MTRRMCYVFHELLEVEVVAHPNGNYVVLVRIARTTQILVWKMEFLFREKRRR